MHRRCGKTNARFVVAIVKLQIKQLLKPLLSTRLLALFGLALLFTVVPGKSTVLVPAIADPHEYAEVFPLAISWAQQIDAKSANEIPAARVLMAMDDQISE